MENYITVLGVVGWVVTVLGVAFVLPYFLNSKADATKNENMAPHISEEGRNSP